MSKRFATLNSLKGGDAGGGDASSDGSGDEGQQAFYAGGGERSGQQVLGPPGPRNPNTTAGLAQRLQEAVAAQGEAPAGDAQDGPEVTLTLWADGFSVDDGPLRDPNSPDGRAFMDMIRQGRVPQELIQQHGQSVNLRLNPKVQENYRPPPMKPFSGAGNRLGVPTGASSAPTPQQAADANPVPTQAAAAAPPPVPEMKLKEGEPTTTIQIRLADGTRLRTAANEGSTLTELRGWLVEAREELHMTPFIFQGGFPPKPLEDETKTLKDAGLLNAMLSVKLQNNL